MYYYNNGTEYNLFYLVRNPIAGYNGKDFETIEETKQLAISHNVSRERLVSEIDFINMKDIMKDFPFFESRQVIKRSDVKTNEVEVYGGLEYNNGIVETTTQNFTVDKDTLLFPPYLVWDVEEETDNGEMIKYQYYNPFALMIMTEHQRVEYGYIVNNIDVVPYVNFTSGSTLNDYPISITKTNIRTDPDFTVIIFDYYISTLDNSLTMTGDLSFKIENSVFTNGPYHGTWNSTTGIMSIQIPVSNMIPEPIILSLKIYDNDGYNFAVADMNVTLVYNLKDYMISHYIDETVEGNPGDYVYIPNGGNYTGGEGEDNPLKPVYSLMALNINNTSFVLNWDPTNNPTATGFHIYKDGVLHSTVGWVNATTISGLVSGTQCLIEVQAYKDSFTSRRISALRVATTGSELIKRSVFEIPLIGKEWYDALTTEEKKHFESSVIQKLITNLNSYDYKQENVFLNYKFLKTGGIVWSIYANMNAFKNVLVRNVEHMDRNTPPSSPSVNDKFLVGEFPTGAWAGQANMLTIYQPDFTWRFIEPEQGMWVSEWPDEGLPTIMVYCVDMRWREPFVTTPLQLKLTVTTDISSDAAVVAEDVKTTILDTFNNENYIGINPKLFRSQIIKQVQSLPNVSYCEVMYPLFNIDMNVDLNFNEIPEELLMNYIPEYVYLRRDKIQVYVKKERIS